MNIGFIGITTGMEHLNIKFKFIDMEMLFRLKGIVLFCFILHLLAITYDGYAQSRPIGSVKIGDGLYYDQTEIDVGSWLSYYNWVLIHEGYEAARKVLPDSSTVETELWQYINVKTTDYIEKVATYSGQPIGYFGKKCENAKSFGKRLPKTRLCPLLNLPITGLTYEQVIAFCKWRTELQGKDELIFRLPTPEEWITVANRGLKEQEKELGHRDSLNSKNCPNYNFNIAFNCLQGNYQGKINVIGIYFPEQSGAFDIFGNVSEMTSIKGIAKGGNYTLYASQCHPDSTQFYSKPEPWLGFRCIAERIKAKANKHTSTTSDSSVVAKWVQQKSKGAGIQISESDGNKFGTFTDPRDGKVYRTVRIGEQLWMAQNLAYKPEEGVLWSYKNKSEFSEQNGYLYDWETASKVCPIGWRLPDKIDVNQLFNYIGNDPSNLYSELSVTGSSGFSIIDIGIRLGTNYTLNNTGTAFWTASEKDNRRAVSLCHGRINPRTTLNDTFFKRSGLYVRCIIVK